MKFTAWEARKHIENKYKTALRKLGRFLIDSISEDDTLDDILTKFSKVQTSKPFMKWAQSLAKTFVTNTLEENARTWRQAAAMSGQGETIRQGLENEMASPVGAKVTELVEQNAQYIKSVPESVSKDLTKHIQSQAFQGSRTAYKTDDFKKMVGEMSANHAKLISRTETSKAMSALTQARAEYVGLDWYIWHTSEDVRVRESHKHMDKVLCRFSDPPSPEQLVDEKSVGKYSPGNVFNCRCYAAPVILWRNVEWPHDVYSDGSITKMSKKQFEDKFGVIK